MPTVLQASQRPNLHHPVPGTLKQQRAPQSPRARRLASRIAHTSPEPIALCRTHPCAGREHAHRPRLVQAPAVGPTRIRACASGECLCVIAQACRNFVEADGPAVGIAADLRARTADCACAGLPVAAARRVACAIARLEHAFLVCTVPSRRSRMLRLVVAIVAASTAVFRVKDEVFALA